MGSKSAFSELQEYFEADDVHLRPFSHSSRGCLGHSTDLILYCYGRRPKGFWTGWTSWSACSMDNHVRTRFRTCQKTPASARTWRYDCLHKKNSTSVEGISRNLLTYLLTKDFRIRPRQISCKWSNVRQITVPIPLHLAMDLSVTTMMNTMLTKSTTTSMQLKI